MLKLKIRETVLNACNTLAANDPYKRWHSRHYLDFKTVARNINSDIKKITRIAEMNLQHT